MNKHNIKYSAPLILILILLMTVNQKMTAQKDSLALRKYSLLSIGLAGTAGSYYLLDQLWYKNYERSKFHFFNDNSEWMQMDKAGHIFSSYTLGSNAYSLMKWSGASENQSLWLGGNFGLIYLAGIELMDSKSDAWGFSNGDMIANVAGSFLFISQQKFWNEQRIKIKFSYQPTQFPNYNSELLGRNFQQRVLKDYNGQTYWASINTSSFLAPDATFPKWMNFAIGYGATNMIRAKNNVNDVNNFQHKRELYISFDADLTRVRWKKKWMMTTAKILSFIKIPSPTFEIRNDGRIKMHALFF